MMMLNQKKKQKEKYKKLKSSIKIKKINRDVLEIYKNGEELLDPYTGDVIGYEEETVAFVIVFEVNSKTNLVKAAVEPKGEYEKAEIVKGYGVRAKMVQKGKKEVVENQKAKLQKFKTAGIMK